MYENPEINRNNGIDYLSTGAGRVSTIHNILSRGSVFFVCLVGMADPGSQTKTIIWQIVYPGIVD